MFVAASPTAVTRKSKYTHAYVCTHAYTHREVNAQTLEVY